MKKAQVTFFIIVGLLILISVVYLFMVTSKTGSVIMRDDSITTYMYSCLEIKAQDGLYRLGMHAGDIDFPGSIEDIEHSKQGFERFMVHHAQDCINNYPNDEALNIEFGEPEVNIVFEKSTTVMMSNIYSYEKGNTYKMSQDFTIELPIRYKEIQEVALQLEHGNYLPDSDVLKTPGLDIEVARYSGSELWLITDHMSKNKDKPFYFAFII